MATTRYTTDPTEVVGLASASHRPTRQSPSMGRGGVRTAVHGMARIGPNRMLKGALESYWRGSTSADDLESVAASIRLLNWQKLVDTGIDFLPSNDFSLYDHVLDAITLVGAVPRRFQGQNFETALDQYFAMARGFAIGDQALPPLELTKWFDTNYHHLVAELEPDLEFVPNTTKLIGELIEANKAELSTTPVLLGPVTFLLRSSTRQGVLRPLDLLDPLIDIYLEVLSQLARKDIDWVRFDEPSLVEDRTPDELAALEHSYRRLAESGARPKIALSTYFGHVGSAMPVLVDLPIEGLGLDLRRGGENVEMLREVGGSKDKVLFAGVVDGRNVWKNDLDKSLSQLEELTELASEVVVSTSCSLMHVPQALTTENALDPEIRRWLAFGDEKLEELAVLALGLGKGRDAIADEVETNRSILESRRNSERVVNGEVRERLSALAGMDHRRSVGYEKRKVAQQARLQLPALPTTTIGSFPQRPELRTSRAAWRAGKLDESGYRRVLRDEIALAVSSQEEIGLDVLVHGEAERDDMVRYFAEQLAGFALTKDGWVQSYGSRYVRPPILYGDVARNSAMTLEWLKYAQSLTTKPVKGMLTGPVTILRWSFVRDDQPEADSARQIALAMRDEIIDLQSIGTAIIQIDEPGLREGMPLRGADRTDYLEWATRCFRLVSSAAEPSTQLHTHMCYAQLGDIVDVLEQLDVDVVSLEAARAVMSLVDDLEHAKYRGALGPGVYDVHSPTVPGTEEIEVLLRRGLGTLGSDRLWVNPDCGLKTRSYEEVSAALRNMVAAAHRIREGTAEAIAVSKNAN